MITTTYGRIEVSIVQNENDDDILCIYSYDSDEQEIGMVLELSEAKQLAEEIMTYLGEK